MCVWLGGWKSELMEKKKFCLVKKKNEMMIENVICINLFSLKKINSLIFF